MSDLLVYIGTYTNNPQEGIYCFRLVPAAPASVASTAGAGPRHFIFHPNGRIAYLLNELDGTLNVYDFAAERGVSIRAVDDFPGPDRLQPGVVGPGI